MSRYIDADGLVIDYYDDYETEDDVYTYPFVSKDQIDSAPTIKTKKSNTLTRTSKSGKWAR